MQMGHSHAKQQMLIIYRCNGTIFIENSMFMDSFSNKRSE